MQDLYQETNQNSQVHILVDNQEAAREVARRLYDANAIQNVYITVIEDGEPFKVSHEFKSHSDEIFYQFDAKRESLLSTNEQNKEITLKTKIANASLWFWELFCQGVSGYGDPNVPLPDNWREMLKENDEDKLQAVKGIFSAQIVPKKKTDTAKFASWNRNKAAHFTIECIFDGEIIETEHFLKAKTAEVISEWTDLTGDISFKNQRLLEENSEMKIPATAREKVAFYDKLIDRTEGYAGRVPAEHKLLVINEYFSSTAKTAKKPQP